MFFEDWFFEDTDIEDTDIEDIDIEDWLFDDLDDLDVKPSKRIFRKFEIFTGERMSLIMSEEGYPDFFSRWEKTKSKILKKHPHLKNKDNIFISYIMDSYCAIVAKYTYDLECKEEKKYFQLEEYILLLTYIQMSLKEKFKVIDICSIIDEIYDDIEEYKEEKKLLETIKSFNYLIRDEWDGSRQKIDHLNDGEHKEILKVLSDKVLQEEIKIVNETSEFIRKSADFPLKDASELLTNLYNAYNKALAEFMEKYKSLHRIERSVINSPKKICDFTIEAYLEESKMLCENEKHQLVYVIFENGTVVELIDIEQDVKKIGKEAKKRLIKSKDEGIVESLSYDYEINDRNLSILYQYQSQEMRYKNGICNYFWEDTYDYYFNNDLEIAKENRNKDIEDRKIRCILYGGKVFFDSKKDEKECK